MAHNKMDYSKGEYVDAPMVYCSVCGGPIEGPTPLAIHFTDTEVEFCAECFSISVDVLIGLIRQERNLRGALKQIEKGMKG